MSKRHFNTKYINSIKDKYKSDNMKTIEVSDKVFKELYSVKCVIQLEHKSKITTSGVISRMIKFTKNGIW